jgi:RimJ/RimL family protein N-acetyltransferase
MSGAPPSVAATERLVLRRLVLDDAAFILELLNEPGWLRFIGDRGVRTLEDARAYLERVPMTLYAKHGFGLYAVELRADATPVGMCGLIRRDVLPDPDIGFALLSRHEGRGYAIEAAQGVVRHAREDVKLPRLAAIVNPENRRSIGLLGKLGMRFERMIRMPNEDRDIELYGMDLVPPGGTP